MEELYPNSSGLDVHKTFVVACVYVQGNQGRLRAERKRFGTTTNELLMLVSWLQAQCITHVVMESTGVYWKPIYNILHPHFDVWVVNARHLAQVPGRKTDETDAEWITKLMRHGLLRNSFIPDEWQRDLRDLTRYRTRLVQEKHAATNRLHKLLEDANIKLSSVVSDVQGVSARAMIEALIADEMDVEAMADLAQKRMRAKIPQLVEALTGHMRTHHRFLLEEVLTHLDELNARINTLNTRITDAIAPYQSLVEQLDSITGVGLRTIEIVLAEIGPDVSRWPTAAHLASWACVCPGNNESGGKRKSGKRRRGQKWLVSALVEAAWAASRAKNAYLASLFHRIQARRGAKRAAIAVAHAIVKIIYHLLQNPGQLYQDLGGDYFLNKNKEQERRRALKTLESLGFEVVLSTAAA